MNNNNNDDIILCDLCGEPAVYDSKLSIGSWAYVCKYHFNQYGVKIKGMYTKLNNSNNKSEED